jgi:hypothetical protein
VFQYSGGVASQPGYEIKLVPFSGAVVEGFDFIEQFIRAAGRPVAYFAKPGRVFQ